MKKSTSVNLQSSILNFLEQEAEFLSISRNELIETLTILHMEQQKISLAVSEIDDFIDSFPLKNRGNSSQKFRPAIHMLPPKDAWTLVVFFSALNLIPDVEVSVNRFSNIWKRNDPICYFAYGSTIARQSIQTLIDKQINTVAKIHNQQSAGGPFFFSCLQQLKHTQPYPHWRQFLQLLKLPSNTTVIEVDQFTLLNTILPALKQL